MRTLLLLYPTSELQKQANATERYRTLAMAADIDIEIDIDIDLEIDIDIEIVIEKDIDADIEKESDSVVAKIFAFSSQSTFAAIILISALLNKCTWICLCNNHKKTALG